MEVYRVTRHQEFLVAAGDAEAAIEIADSVAFHEMGDWAAVSVGLDDGGADILR